MIDYCQDPMCRNGCKKTAPCQPNVRSFPFPTYATPADPHNDLRHMLASLAIDPDLQHLISLIIDRLPKVVRNG